MSDYQKWVQARDQGSIADFIFHRLHSRYLKPHTYPGNDFGQEYKNGFGIMASCCLLIETLQCFKMGIVDDTGIARDVFIKFFESEDEFSKLEISGVDFYKDIRCGILHQGETKNGWSIRREGTKTIRGKQINAIKFAATLERSLQSYSDNLKREPWESQIWIDFRKKMDGVIANCRARA